MHLTILSKRQSVSCLPSEEVRVSVGCLNTSRGSAVDCEVKSMVGVREKLCGGGTSELPSAQESVDIGLGDLTSTDDFNQYSAC